MLRVQAQYIVDEQQVRKAVILPVDDWERIIEELEELDDLRSYDEAKQEPEESVPFEQALQEIEDGHLP